MVVYVALLLLRRGGVLLLIGSTLTIEPSLRELFRGLTVNVVAFVATGALAARLSIELERASDRIGIMFLFAAAADVPRL